MNRPARGQEPERSPGRLRARALRLLARREYSEREIEQRLLHAGGDCDTVRAIVADLRAAGYLSDQRVAESAVRQKQGRFSKRYIGEALKAKGITGNIAIEALAGVEQEDFAAALELWRRRFGCLPPDEREKARQLRFLQARGFAPALLLRIWREHGSASDEDH